VRTIHTRITSAPGRKGKKIGRLHGQKNSQFRGMNPSNTKKAVAIYERSPYKKKRARVDISIISSVG